MHPPIAAFVFWFCLAVPAYVYFGYPALLASGLLGKRKAIRRAGTEPTVSIIVAAHNEERVIADKIDNLLALEYPRERLEILIANDGSTDQTADIVRQFADRGVRLVGGMERRGKSAAQNDAATRALGEILVFSDADCMVTPRALQTAMRNFADPEVGLVTGTAIFLNSDTNAVSQNENLYSRYEAWIRGQESDRGLLAAASGSFFAIRRELWHPLERNVGDDFVLPLQVALQGRRNVLDANLLATTDLPVENSSMFKVKKRIVSKDLRGLLQNAAVLNPLRTGALAAGLWSHKLLRWLVAYFLCGMLMANMWLVGNPFYRATLLAQILFYAMALIAVSKKETQIKLPWSVAVAFCVVNCAAMAGVFDCVTHRGFGQWKPVR